MGYKDIQTFSDLKHFLRNWGKNETDEEYDFIGIVNLFIASLDNIMQFALPVELKDIGDHLNDDEKGLLIKLAEYIRKS